MNLNHFFRTKQFFFALASLTIMNNRNSAQTESSSYDVPTDARSIAMGQSFVALAGNQHALLFNPAGLTGLKGVSISYSKRNVDWNQITDGFGYHATSLSVATPFAVLGFSYNRLNLGEFVVTNPSGLETGRYTPYDHTFALGASRDFGNGFAAGVSVKTFNFVTSVVRTPSNPTGITNSKNTIPILFDIGAIHQVPHQFNEDVSGNFGLGFSFQNYGSNLIVKDDAGQQLGSVQLSRYLRIGGMYSITVGQPEATLIPFIGMVTAEYRKLLNGFTTASSDFYGFGFEMRVFEVVSGKIGGFLSNIRWIYGEPKKVSFRYGFGINIPLQKIGMSAPLEVGFDYAVIPLNKSLGHNFFAFQRNSLNAFSVQIQYNKDFF